MYGQFRSLPYYEIQTYVRVRPIVVSLYVIKVGGRTKSVILPIQPTQPAGNRSEPVSKEGDIVNKYKQLADIC
jgi:hypothetical protein